MKKNLYSRPNKPFFVENKHRRPRSTDTGAARLPKPKKPIVVHGGTDCFVTPPEVAARMADYASLESGQIVFEPEAGSGNIIQALIDTQESIKLFANELNYTLFETLTERFSHPALTITQGDFLEISSVSAKKFIMNPPFSKRQAYKHIEHARSLLNGQGLIIALVPSNFQIDGMYEIESLPRGTFTGTDIGTKIIEIEA